MAVTSGQTYSVVTMVNSGGPPPGQTYRFGGASPVVQDLSPVDGGSFGATFSAGRKTPVTFTLSGIINKAYISVKWANSEARYSVRDADGFTPLFVDHSTYTGDGLGNGDYSILPRGGWPASVEKFFVGDFAEAVVG